MMQNRTHTCGELRLSDAGKAVKLCGWLENVREVGGELAFAVLRDFYGTTQVVAETADMVKTLKAINKESTISVEGTVRERDSKNAKLPTGDIEVVPEKITVLGRCRHNELPFPINRSREADEATRLKYRYLDLRNPAVKDNIILRCNVVSALRQAMTAHGFLEITTPILTASSPEGARDYLVPARNHPGKFYALPQAPQQFKQLLMTSGFDRYFQIAPCFRDEDARADRSPGEFYQLDMEMAFASQDDVFAVLEDVLPPIFAKYGKYDRASSAPFVRIPYTEAMEKYGSDKPDLRIDLTVQDVTSVLGACGFGPFEGNTVKAVVVSDFHETRKFIDKTLADVEVVSGGKPYWFRLDENGEIVGGIAKFVNPIKEQVISALNLKPNDFVALSAGKLGAAQKTAGVLVKKVKCDFKKLGPKFGKQMKSVAAAVAGLSQEAIAEFERKGVYTLTLSDGTEAAIETSDVEIISEDIPGWLVANEGKLTVALEVTITEELRREGIARELVNRIQNIRKSNGFEITDKIKIELSKNQQTDEAVIEYKDYICNQVLANSLQLVDEVENATELEFDDFTLYINVVKA